MQKQIKSLHGGVKVAETERNSENADARVSKQVPASLPDLESFRAALDAGQVGVWAWDLRSHQITWSTKLEDFHGRSPDSLDGALSIVPQDFPSQDAAGVLAAIHQTLHTQEPCRLEYRLPGQPGDEERWFEASTTVVMEDGAAVQLLTRAGPRGLGGRAVRVQHRAGRSDD